MDVINELIAHVIRTEFGDLPSDVVHTTKRFLLDSIGTLIAGTSAPGCKEVVTQIKDWGGKPEATIAVYGDKVPAPNAALINSMMIHARDFDDTHDLSSVHAFATVLPAVMASSEMLGRIDGKVFLTALVLGTDIACRVGLGMRYYKGWHYSSVCGTFGAVAGAGKIWNLSHKEMLNAMGIVYSLAAGNVQCVRDKALVKRMQPGFAAQAGMAAIAYAKAGITGTKNTLEGNYGFFNLYDERGLNEHNAKPRSEGRHGPHEVTRGLGKQFEMVNLSMKPYPCCRYTHPAIDGALQYIGKYNVAPDQVVEVKVYVSKFIYDAVGEPFDLDEDGPQQVKAQFSIPYTVALTLVKTEKPDICDFEEKSIRSRWDVLAMAGRIKVEVDSKLSGRIPVILIIRTQKESYKVTINHLKGSPDTPMTDEESREKFLRCTDYSVYPIPKSKISSIIDRIEEIEKNSNTQELISTLN